MIDREIKFNLETRDFDCYVDGRYVGSRANYHQGELLCDQVAYDLLADGLALTAAELDGGADDDEQGGDCPDHGPYADDDCPKCAAAYLINALDTAYDRLIASRS